MDVIFGIIFHVENVLILLLVLLNWIPKHIIDDKPALIQVMAWCWVIDKPLVEQIITKFYNVV